MSGTTVDAPARYRDALGHQEFRGVIVAQVLSEWGDHIARVALASLVLVRTDSAFLAVLAFVVSFIPAVFGAALLGSLADRLPRKIVLLACDLGRGVLIALLALLAVDSTPVWVLLLVLLLAEIFLAPFEAAQRSIVPDLLPEPRLALAGMGLMRVLYQLDQVIGIALAGLVIYFVGVRWGLVLDAMTFGCSFLVLALTLRWRPASHAPGAAPTSLLQDFRAGFRLVFDDPALRALVVLGWGAALFIIAPEAVALAYARHEGASSGVGAALMASVPAGAALGAHLVGRLGPVRQVQLLIPLAIATCLPLLLTCVSPPWEVAMALWFVSGLGQGFLLPLIGTVNLVAPAAYRGRVNGLAGAGFSLASASSFLLAGALADATSPAVAVTTAGAVGLALIGAVHRSWPRGAIGRAAARVYAGD
ncbi:MAG: MFS transporter [Actinomycetes bacterium]